MKYVSTRNKDYSVSASEAILKGLAEDGGLFTPVTIPKITDLESLLSMDYKQMAHQILSLYLSDISKQALKQAIDLAYDNKFTTNEIVNVVEVGDLAFLELFHGPTFAFKDVALSLLPHLLKQALKNTNEKRKIIILTATSGDTGKAALESFVDVNDVDIVVFYPKEGVSQIQKRQMITQVGSNTHVIGVKGNFDDAQQGVKALMNDEQFIEQLNQQGYMISSANSINIGRLLPQIVYYFYSYINLVKQHKINLYEKINYVVPTGNFGNILAAFYASEMGLPISKLVCASNENNVLSDFFHTNTYNINRKLIVTSSPSMDIIVSSNVERLLFYVNKNNSELTKKNMDDLKLHGKYTLKEKLPKVFEAFSISEEETTQAIKEVYKEHHYLMDPHTAVAYKAYTKYLEKTKDTTKTVVVSTASPFKFQEKVASSIGISTHNKDDFQVLEELSKTTNQPIPHSILSLKDQAILHTLISTKETMKQTVIDILEKGKKHD